jgi:hypothetical protein
VSRFSRLGPIAAICGALRLLRDLSGQCLFSGAMERKPFSNMAILMLLRDLRGNGYTVHGFRSAFSTWARVQTDYPREMSRLVSRMPQAMASSSRTGAPISSTGDRSSTKRSTLRFQPHVA